MPLRGGYRSGENGSAGADPDQRRQRHGCLGHPKRPGSGRANQVWAMSTPGRTGRFTRRIPTGAGLRIRASGWESPSSPNANSASSATRANFDAVCANPECDSSQQAPDPKHRGEAELPPLQAGRRKHKPASSQPSRATTSAAPSAASSSAQNRQSLDARGPGPRQGQPASSECTNHSKQQEQGILCLKRIQRPLFGRKRRRAEIISRVSHTFNSIDYCYIL